MNILYVQAGFGEEGTSPIDGLVALDPALRVGTAAGPAAALAELRAWTYEAVVLSPRLSPNETLALIATLRRDRTPVAIVAIIEEDQRPFLAQALMSGADDVLLLKDDGLDTPEDTLRRIRQSRHLAAPAKGAASRQSPQPPSPTSQDEPRPHGDAAEIARLTAALAEARQRLRNSEDARDRQERLFGELQETLAFERALRDRDQEEMARLRKSSVEERERRVVLEGTLRHTEDRSANESDDIESRHSELVDRLERHIEQLQDELTARTAERDRLIQHELFGWATVTAEGVLISCNTTFARMFGYEDPADAIADSAAGFAGLTDHAFLVEQLKQGKTVDRVSSVLRGRDGRSFHVLTSAAFLASGENEAPLVERMLIDLDDRSRLDEQLRLARRLEAAGRLTAEMAPEIEAMLAADEDSAGADNAHRVSLLIKQLIAFTRHQAKPAGLLSLTDALRRAEPRLRQIGGDLVEVTLELEDAGPIAASEEDVERLLSALAFTAIACLPYGGALTFRTRSTRDGFDQRTELSLTASGYGVHPVSISSSLTRLVTKCGGTVRSTDDPARATTLHVFLPC